MNAVTLTAPVGSSVSSSNSTPVSKNYVDINSQTAGAVALAALSVMVDGADPLLLVLPCDKIIDNMPAFRTAVLAQSELANTGALVTFGFGPTQCFRDSGVYLFKASAFLNELERFAPELLARAGDVFSRNMIDGGIKILNEDVDCTAHDISIDSAVMKWSGKVRLVSVMDIFCEAGHGLAAESNLVEIDHARPVSRPWGFYECIGKAARYQVKRITVLPGQKLSVQLHYHRAEHWVVVAGTAKVKVGDNEVILTENQSTYIPLGVVHALENPGKISLELIEVQSGPYLGEDDIVRFEDRYGRV